MLRYVVALVAIFCFSSSAQAALLGLQQGFPPRVFELDPVPNTKIVNVTLRGELLGNPPGPTSQFGLRGSGFTFLRGKAYGSRVTQFSATRHVGEIDLANNTFRPITSTVAGFGGLASNEAANLLYAVDRSDNFKLVTITPNGNVTSIGSGTGIDVVEMAFDDKNGILYAVDTRTDLYTIDIDTGIASIIGATAFGPRDSFGLAYDEETETLFGVGGRQLAILDKTTGASTPGSPPNPGDGFFVGIIQGVQVPNIFDFNGLAWVNDKGCSALSCDFGSDVPTPAPLGLMLLGLAGLVLIRRVG